VRWQSVRLQNAPKKLPPRRDANGRSQRARPEQGATRNEAMARLAPAVRLAQPRYLRRRNAVARLARWRSVATALRNRSVVARRQCGARAQPALSLRRVTACLTRWRSGSQERPAGARQAQQ